MAPTTLLNDCSLNLSGSRAGTSEPEYRYLYGSGMAEAELNIHEMSAG